MSAHLSAWRLHLALLLDSSGARNFSSSPTAPLLVCPGQWHHLRVAILPEAGISVTLDGQRTELDLLHVPAGAIAELRSLHVQVGGASGAWAKR